MSEGNGDRYRLHAAVLQLKAIRLERGLSQDDVAKLMGTQQSAISEIEAFATEPMLTTISRYARAVGARVRIHVDEEQSS